MTSVKIKFRASTVNGSPGSIYFQIIHNRVVRQLHTDYKIYPHEWDADTESIIVSGDYTPTTKSIPMNGMPTQNLSSYRVKDKLY